MSEMEPGILALFHEFMTQGTFTDVSFIIGNVSALRAHKIILAAYSPVFRAMFETDMLELKTHQVVLTDVSKADFRAFLDFLYTRELKYIENHLSQMYMLADKYDVRCLEAACDDVIVGSLSKVSAPTIINRLLLVDSFKRDGPKNIVLGYVRQNLQSVMSGEEWKTLLDHPSLLREVIRTVATEDRAFFGSEIQRSLCLDSAMLSRIKNNEEFDFTWEESTEGSSKTLVYGNNQIEIATFNCKSLYGRIHASLHLQGEINVSVPCFLSIESSAQLKNRNFSRNQSTIDMAKQTGFCAYNFVVFEHNWLFFSDVKVSVTLKLFPHTHVTHQPLLITSQTIRQRFTDAVILVKGSRFPVHKVILAGKSKFFGDLFQVHQSPRKEHSDEYQLDVEGLSAKSFGLLMDYTYLGRHPDYGTENLVELLIGSSTFQLEEVVNHCISLMAKTISYGNVEQILVIGDKMNIKSLKTAALNYLLQHKGDVESLEELKTHPELLKEVLLKMTGKPQDQ